MCGLIDKDHWHHHNYHDIGANYFNNLTLAVIQKKDMHKWLGDQLLFATFFSIHLILVDIIYRKDRMF